MFATLTELFPAGVCYIITDYVHQLEHQEKWRLVCREIKEMHWIRKRLILNIQFHSIFYADFFQELGML